MQQTDQFVESLRNHKREKRRSKTIFRKKLVKMVTGGRKCWQ